MASSRIKIDEDRISSLPDCVIHCVFRSMEMIQVVQTSVLSKRWTSVWESTSHLNFRLDQWQPNIHTGHRRWHYDDNCRLIETFLDKVLLGGRNHSYDLHTFNLSRFHNCQATKLNAWVDYVMCRNVQEVTLVSAQLNASTVTALCENVKLLKLRGVDILFEKESSELLLSCPIMETLVLNGCDFYEVDYLKDPCECFNIKLCAPNLKVFEFKECMSRNYTLENLSNVLNALIDVDIWCVEVERSEDLLGNILGLPNVESLVFSFNGLLESKIPITLNKVATFQSLRYLKLTTGDLGIYCFSTTLRLLEKSPNVETLVLDGKLNWDPEFAENDLVAGLMSWCRLCHLKTFKIEGQHIQVSARGFKFLECLMQNTRSLQNVVMTTSKTTKDKEKLVNLCKKLNVPPNMTMVSSDRIGVLLKPSRKIHWEIAEKV